MNTKTEKYTHRKTVAGLNPGVISRLHNYDRPGERSLAEL